MLTLQRILRVATRFAPTALALVFVARIVTAQDRYVNAQCGSNFSDGLTPATAWKTVEFALHGPQAPLPVNTTIHLIATNGVSYSAATGEVFPWVLYNNMSLVADPATTSCDPSATDHIVDSAGHYSLQYAAHESFSGCVIRGITFVNYGRAIDIAPSGTRHAPLIEHCTFGPTLPNSSGIFAQAISGSITATVRHNAFIGGADNYSSPAAGVWIFNAFNDSPTGTTILDGNTFTGAIDIRMSVSQSVGHVEVTNNTFTGGYGTTYLEVSAYGETLVRGNTCDGGGPNISVGTCMTVGGPGIPIVVEGNIVAGGTQGISVYGSVQVLGNTVSSTSHFSGLLVGMGPNDTMNIARNLVTHCNGDGLLVSAYYPSSTLSIDHNTIVDNAAYGIRQSSTVTNVPTVTNCIIWGNNAGGCDTYGIDVNRFAYCDIGACASPGNGVISAPPLFVDPTNLDYHLQGGSPCINSGDPTSPLDCDGTLSDMGAFPTGACGSVFCLPSQGGVRACPCSNAGGPSGGCNNSASTGGAILSGTGAASLGCDTVQLTSSGELPVATSIFLQGTTMVPAGVTFGQGVRCVGGTLKRLYVKSASGGVAIAPVGGDPSVHDRSAAVGDVIASGTTRYYQTYYRDPNVLGGCPGISTFNASQALSIAWTP